MKVLMIAPYVTVTSRPEFSRNITGFGYMVMDIASAVASKVRIAGGSVDLLATDSRGEGFLYGGVHILPRRIMLFLANVLNIIPLSKIIHLFRAYHNDKAAMLRLLYYGLMTGYVNSLIKNGDYDIVHIHGCHYATDLWMSCCQTHGQKYVVTLHGLNSFSDTVALSEEAKVYERDFLNRVVKEAIPITVISTGMKRLIEENYSIGKCYNISVICNSFSFYNSSLDGGSFDIRAQQGIGAEEKIVICVGNICKRKNQGQLIRAFDLLKEELAEHTYIFFLGNSLDNEYSIEKLSAGSPWKSHFIKCGIVPKEIVKYYYGQSDAVVLMSLSEGFGLSLIEGMYFGKPCMSFSDVDAFTDIFHHDVMIGIDEHSDEAVARGLEELLTKKWNEDRIKEYSRKFESATMATNYINVYKAIETTEIH